MDYLSQIKQPIEAELNDFIGLFNQSLSHSDGLLETALSHIRNRGGKRMRPILMLLMAKNYGVVSLRLPSMLLLVWNSCIPLRWYTMTWLMRVLNVVVRSR